MFEELLDFSCECGRHHSLTTCDYFIEKDALQHLLPLMEKLGVSQKPLAIYDQNTFDAAFGKLDSHAPGIDQLILDGDEIHPDERQIGAVIDAAPGHSILLAVGSGVINDVVRFAAHKIGMSFISVPTAASVDGYVSGSAAVTLKGAKQTLPAVAPVAVVADLEIIAAAPAYLAAAGVGDMLSKYLSIADWRMGNFVTGEYFCERTAQLSSNALKMVVDNIDHIAAAGIEGMGKLMEGLIVSGITLQLVDVTRPGSSFEHHFSHYLEVVPMPDNINVAALHGEKVGIASIIGVKYYETFIKRLQRIYEESLPNKFSEQRIRDYFADNTESLIQAVLEENRPSISLNLKTDLLREHFGGLLDIAHSLPSYQSLIDVLEKVEGMTHYRDIGMTQEQFRDVMGKCCYIRNRFTTLRLMCDYELFDFSTMDD